MKVVQMEGTDLFCGAGGVTEGIHRARYQGKPFAWVRSCVNHDPLAIASHASNHKNTYHFTEDITIQDPTSLPKPASSLYRRTFLHASLECTNHSKAKGGMSREQDSRTLADHLGKYIDWLQPDYITIENVKEFLIWGPLQIKVATKKLDDGTETSWCPLEIKKKGKGKNRIISIEPVWVPIPERKAEDFNRWVSTVCHRGYRVEWKVLNVADFGGYTSRERLIMIFAKDDLLIRWPEKTHHKTGANGLKKWKAVKPCLDLKDEGGSIFGRKKPLVDATFERIYAGLVKYVARGDDSFIMKYFSGDAFGKVISLNGPAGTIRTRDGQYVTFIHKYNSAKADRSRENSSSSIDNPCPTVTTQGRLSVVNLNFMAKYHGKITLSSVDSPSLTLPTHDSLSIVKVFIDKQYSSGGRHQSVESPAGSITTVPKLQLVNLQYLDKQYGRKNHYLVNPQYKSKGASTEQPCFTLIARMDKAPPYLVTAETGEPVIVIYPEDSEIVKKIKLFMAIYGIIDIKMRMLKIPELKHITGFPAKYILKGSKTLQKKFIGNAVRDHGDELKRLISLTPFSRTEFELSYKKTSRRIEQARRTVVRSFMGHGSGASSKIKTGFRSNSHRTNGTNAASDWKNFPPSLDSIIQRLKGVVIENKDYYLVAKQHDSRHTLHYWDPPYKKSTRSKSSRNTYKKEMNDADHKKLCKRAKEMIGSVIISGYDNEIYNDHLPNWKKVSKETFADGGRKRIECLWLSPDIKINNQLSLDIHG